MESSTVTQPAGTIDTSAPGAKGLKADALGYASNLVIAIASTAPAYSLAATLGFIVAVTGVGVHAPAVLIVSFIPILFVSVGYRFFNLADPDAGTTFAWVTRAFGPQLGWINGWAIFLADIIVMASLSEIAANYTFLLFGLHGLAKSNLALIIGSVVWIALMTWICYRGIELSARVQTILLSIEIFTLALFAVVALIKVYANSPAHSIHVTASWFNPFDMSWGALVDAVLLGIFIYWGWDSGVAVNEESRDRHRGPGKAAVVSTADPASDLRDRRRRRPGVPRHGLPRRQLERRPERARHRRVRLAARQAADHHRPHLGLGVDADDDPADRADDAVDGEVGRDPGGLRPRSPALPDSDVLDAPDGRSVDRLDRGAARVQSRTRTCSATRSRRSASPWSSTTGSPGWPAPCTSATICSRALATSSSPG